MNIVFFGSTTDSVVVLEALHSHVPVSAVVTKCAKPKGREQIVTPTPVELWAKTHNIPILAFETDREKPWKFVQEDTVTNAISTWKPDILITACFGARIPKKTIAIATHGGINVHPSLLPRWRGAYPVPWTIIAGDAQTGVTISTITERFDDGTILAQKKIPITDADRAEDLRTKLFTLGAALLVDTLPDYISGKNKGIPQKKEDVTIARKLTRTDGFVSWELVSYALEGIDVPRDKRSGFVQDILEPLPQALIRLHRALTPWPGIWTTITKEGQDKRVKILTCNLVDQKFLPEMVQLEGKNPTEWNTFKNAYLPS